jgi:hypothetical protein
VPIARYFSFDGTLAKINLKLESQFALTILGKGYSVDSIACHSSHGLDGVLIAKTFECVFGVGKDYLPVVEISEDQQSEGGWKSKFTGEKFMVYGDFQPARWAMKMSQQYLLFASKYTGNFF